MKLVFNINPKTKGISLQITFDDDDTMTGREGKQEVYEYLKEELNRIC